MNLSKNQIIVGVVAIVVLLIGISIGKSGIKIGSCDCCAGCHCWGISWSEKEDVKPKPDHRPHPIPRPGVNPFDTGSPAPSIGSEAPKN
jgi:hypothetical protein